MRIALIACTKSKRPYPAPVRDLYISPLFKSTVRYAEAHADKWYVLSAKYGLLSSDKVVAPYEKTLNGASRAECRAWAERVQGQLLEVLPEGADVMVLAGLQYRRDLIPFLEAHGHRITIPLQGKGLGQQLQFLARTPAKGDARPIKTDLDHFYAALRCLAAQPHQGLQLGECNGRMSWPDRGVYFFVEPGEFRQGAEELRVVRVGTHAVSIGSRSTLWGRLRAHRGASDGSGNHRGSVFRRHIGVALLEHGDHRKVTTWGVGSSAPRPVRIREAALELAVTAYLAKTRVFWVDVPDAPGRDSMRSFIERNAIALLSNMLNPLDQPSKEWLGRWSDREEIRKSGLWNVDFVRNVHDPGFLRVLDGCIEQMSVPANCRTAKAR